MRSIQLVCLSLALTACLVSCGDLGGISTLSTPSNVDDNSCIFSITYSVKEKRIVFTVDTYVPDPQNPSCTDPTFTTAPLFYNTPFTAVSLNLTKADNNPTKWTGVFQYADFKAALGSACQVVGIVAGQVQGACRFRFGPYIYFYMGIPLLGENLDTFDTTWSNLIFPELGTVVKSSRFGMDIWVKNTDWSYPHIIARTENGCDTWNSDVTLSTEVLVLGTNWLGDKVNLSTYFSGSRVLSLIALKKGANAKNYVNKLLSTDSSSLTPFETAPSEAGCTDFGIKYGDFLPNANYCSGGCSLSFLIVKGNQVFMLPTNGFRTVTSLRA